MAIRAGARENISTAWEKLTEEEEEGGIAGWVRECVNTQTRDQGEPTTNSCNKICTGSILPSAQRQMGREMLLKPHLHEDLWDSQHTYAPLLP